MYIKPKKSLGQNFLTDKNIQRKLINAYDLNITDRVLEIGAGYGGLTRLIADKTAFVYALEIDQSLCETLKDNTKAYTNIKIINQDILQFDLNKYFKDLKKKIKVIGNIPYYITSPIIEYILEYRNKIETAFITVQKEFANRIVAGAGSKEYGAFSCFVQYFSIPKIKFFITKNSFVPAPKVDSCLLELKIREAPAVRVNNEKFFFKVIRAGFNKRRKTLRNSLDGVVPLEKLSVFFKESGIDKNVRPEDLTIKDFALLTNSI